MNAVPRSLNKVQYYSMPNSLNQSQQVFVKYSSLHKEVRNVLLRGQKKIETAKVETYWHTGRLIQQHLEDHGEGSQIYGQRLVVQLAQDLELSTTTLWRCIKFYETFKKVATWPLSLPQGLFWSHYRQLMVLPEEQMHLFMQRTQENNWTANQLAEKIRIECWKQDWDLADSPASARLIPHRGKLYTYRITQLNASVDGILNKNFSSKLKLESHTTQDPQTTNQPVNAPKLKQNSNTPDLNLNSRASKLVLDLGFHCYKKIPDTTLQNLEANQIVESRLIGEETETGSEMGTGTLGKEKYGIYSTENSEKDLYTYRAFVERVVDADTLLVVIDLGFSIFTSQYLRLRGINAPELSTKEGQKAKQTLEKMLQNADPITIFSTRTEKYGRYLADIYYSPTKTPTQTTTNTPTATKTPAQENETFLNQQLLNAGLAVRM